MSRTRLLGITVLADFILNEGVEAVLDNIVGRAGATAVAVNPTVTAPSEEGVGSFQPPIDAGSSPRLFDRPLWGRRSLWVRSAPSYQPRLSYYADTPYKPRAPDDLTDKYGVLVERFIGAALDRGLKVYLQVPAATPPGLSDADRPLRPDGKLPDRMADTGCLASKAIRDYIAASVRDLLEQYPRISGFRPDWPEYPCYKLDEAFQDFNPQVAHWAAANRFDYEVIRRDVRVAYDYLHGRLENRDLLDFGGPGRGAATLASIFRSSPGIAEWLRLKSALSNDLLRHWRSVIASHGGADKELSANAFMTPLTLWTGFDFQAAAEICDAVSPKLYTMHWSVMVSFWGNTLLARNPGLDERRLVKSLAHLFDLGDEITATRIDQYGYPGPDEPHPIPDEAQRRRIERVCAEVNRRAAVTPLMHGYGPLHDFVRRFRVVAESPVDGVWINRYGYLSDDKLDAVGRIWRQQRQPAARARL